MLSSEGYASFCEQKKQSKFKHPVLGRQCYQAFEIQARLAEVPDGEIDKYPPCTEVGYWVIETENLCTLSFPTTFQRISAAPTIKSSSLMVSGCSTACLNVINRHTVYKLRSRLSKVIKPDQDSIRFYFLCACCKIK